MLRNVSTGTTIATASASDPESQTLTYSLSGTGSENFAVDSSGNVTLVAGLDYETASSFNLTLSASDGVNTTINTIAISISDVNEAPSLSSSLAASSFAENTATGTTIATASASDPESQTLTYSLSGTGSENFAVDSSGNITLVSSLDYETTTSYSLTLTASDGTNSISNTINISVADVIELSIALASSSISIDENASSGSSITTTTTTTDGSGSVTYSLSGTGSDKFAVSSDGTITTVASLDYETTTSYTLTLTATDGTNTVTQNFTVNVNDLKINTLAVTLANSGAALAESSSSGTTVGSSSITNPESETVSYALSGTGSSNFAVDSSGNVTTNATLDFETAKSYSLTLTATAGGNTTTDAFTVNVGNVEELESAVLRYSADYNSASRSGFSATATRGPSGSSLAAYTLEQVGTTNSTAITSVDDTSNNYVPVEINSGTALNWRYYFPVDTSGNGQFAFAPNSSALDGKYYSPLGTAVTTTIANADFLTAGRLEGAEYWFMTTDKSAASIDYNSALARESGTLIVYRNASGYSRTGWNSAISAAGLDSATLSNDLPADISGYSLIVDYRLNVSNKTSLTSEISNLATWLQTPANTFVLLAGEQCCEAAQMLAYGNLVLDAVGGGEVGSASRDGRTDTENFDISSSVASSLFSTLSGDQYYCAGCGPKITQASGSGVNLTPYLSFWSGNELGSDYKGNIFMSTDIEWQTDSASNEENQQLLNALADLPNQTGGSNTTSTYNLYEDQVTLAGEVYKDANFLSFTDSNKRVIAMAVIPIENFAASGSSNDYFIPNFIPKTLWSYGDVGHDYCLGVGNNASACNTYDNYYDFSSIALDSSDMLDTSRFNGSTNELPEGQSMWWQVLNPSGSRRWPLGTNFFERFL